MDEKVPRGSLTANQLLNWTTATQLKLFDRSIALQVEQAMLSRAIDLAQLNQENSFQMSQNHLIWKQNRAACKERLAAQRAQQTRIHPHDVSSVAPKQYPLKNACGGANTSKTCSICGDLKKGTHGRSQNDCPTLGFKKK